MRVPLWNLRGTSEFPNPFVEAGFKGFVERGTLFCKNFLLRIPLILYLLPEVKTFLFPMK